MYYPYNYMCSNCQFRFVKTEDLLDGSCLRMNSPDNPVTITTREIKSSKDIIKENLRVPILSGNVSPAVQNTINSNINEDIMEFKSQMEDAAAEDAQKAKQTGAKFIPYDISNIYAITYNKNGIISISITYDEFIGGRHYYIRVAYNYDLNNGKSLSVLDLFKPGTNGKALINAEIIREIGANPKNYFPGAIKTFKGIADDQPFYIDGSNLALFFGFNEIAPIASQIPVITLPLFKFKDSLKPNILRCEE